MEWQVLKNELGVEECIGASCSSYYLCHTDEIRGPDYRLCGNRSSLQIIGTLNNLSFSVSSGVQFCSHIQGAA
jgi:hypothetical protein